MPNIKKAWKRMRTSEQARKKNVEAKTAIKHVRRRMLASTDGGVKEGADAVYREYCSMLDKAVKRGVLKKNTAVRRKRRAADRLRKAPAAAAAPAPEASATPA
jgi:small subunit ribosomal protein S20